MTRWPLRKLDPSLDLSRHLVDLAQLPQPWDAARLFGRCAPLEVEVGCGKGLFLAQAAGGNAAHDFLGIELAAKYARYSAARLAKLGLSNACVIQGDAQRVLAEILPFESVAAVHVYFPDPWWKKRHKKRRVLNERFLQHVQRGLQLGGSLHFWTDVEEYYQTTLELIRAETALVGPMQVAEQLPQHDLDYRTHFERRTRLHDDAVYRAEFRKPL